MKLDLKNFKAVIFDMDGTMVDNMHFHKNAWTKFAQKYGIKLTEEDFKKKFSGRKNDQIFKELFNKPLTKEEIEKFTEEKEAAYREIYAPHIEEVVGLKQFIQKIQNEGLKLGIATSAPKKNREFVLSSLGLSENTFDAILGHEHTQKGKPDPEIYLKTAEKLGVDPKNCLVFEDTPVGVQAGKNAGMTTVGILTRHTKEELKMADFTINNYLKLQFK